MALIRGPHKTSGLMLSPVTAPAQWECTHSISPMPHLAQTWNQDMARYKNCIDFPVRQLLPYHQVDLSKSKVSFTSEGQLTFSEQAKRFWKEVKHCNVSIFHLTSMATTKHGILYHFIRTQYFFYLVSALKVQCTQIIYQLAPFNTPRNTRKREIFLYNVSNCTFFSFSLGRAFQT